MTADEIDLTAFKITATEQPRLVVSCTAPYGVCGYSTAFSVPASKAGITIADLIEAVREHHPRSHEAAA